MITTSFSFLFLFLFQWKSINQKARKSRFVLNLKTRNVSESNNDEAIARSLSLMLEGISLLFFLKKYFPSSKVWWSEKCEICVSFHRLTFCTDTLDVLPRFYLNGASIISSKCTEPYKKTKHEREKKSQIKRDKFLFLLSTSVENVIKPLSLTCRSRWLPT